MSEAYTRQINLRAEQFAPPVGVVIDAQRSALISELGFRYYARFGNSILNRLTVHAVPGPIEQDLAIESWEYIRKLTGSRQTVDGPTSADWEAAGELARRLAAFFWLRNRRDMEFHPKFAGCGIIDDCFGDVLAGTELYEVKNVERGFRSVDLRQLLIYCALAYANQAPQVRSVCLVNARQGTFFLGDLEEVARGVSGNSATELMSQIIWFISSEQHSQ